MQPNADFAALARLASQDAASAGKGGDWGWLRQDQLVPAVKDAVDALPDNGISKPVRVSDGWHVLKLIRTKPAHPAALADVRPQLVQALRQARNQKVVSDYINAMLRRQPIELNEIDLPRQASGHP